MIWDHWMIPEKIDFTCKDNNKHWSPTYKHFAAVENIVEYYGYCKSTEAVGSITSSHFHLVSKGSVVRKKTCSNNIQVIIEAWTILRNKISTSRLLVNVVWPTLEACTKPWNKISTCDVHPEPPWWTATFARTLYVKYLHFNQWLKTAWPSPWTFAKAL